MNTENSMRYSLRALSIATALLMTSVGFAQAPAGAPAGSTGLCKDGTYYSGATKQGACRGHKGVKDWYAAATTAAAMPAKATAPVAAPAPAPAAPPPVQAAAPVRAAPAPAAASAPAAKTANMPAAVAAAGGGAGLVWANAGTKVYHCQGDRWYGKTKQGQYMTAADAAAKGFKPDHGKACSN
jgi:pyruvate/2-oxoglutarate dehydrogenase complex dihydrolipoamide acyltransferase (E2) component